MAGRHGSLSLAARQLFIDARPMAALNRYPQHSGQIQMHNSWAIGGQRGSFALGR